MNLVKNADIDELGLGKGLRFVFLTSYGEVFMLLIIGVVKTPMESIGSPGWLLWQSFPKLK